MVRFEAYLAITSNTLQMGARATVKLSAGGFGIDGGGSFDTLIQWSPFHLEVDVAAWVRVTAGGTTILSLNLSLSVTGPAPWHLTGTAEFHLLFLSVSVRVDLTLGSSSTATTAVETVDVPGLVWARVSSANAWEAVLPASATPGAVIGGAQPDPTRVLAHPLATVSRAAERRPVRPADQPCRRPPARGGPCDARPHARRPRRHGGHGCHGPVRPRPVRRRPSGAEAVGAVVRVLPERRATTTGRSRQRGPVDARASRWSTRSSSARWTSRPRRVRPPQPSPARPEVDPHEQRAHLPGPGTASVSPAPWPASRPRAAAPRLPARIAPGHRTQRRRASRPPRARRRHRARSS